MRYINSSQDPLDVGRALAVDAVLEGSLQRENGRVRLTLRMINVSTGKQMWSANFDESDKDIFRLQDSLSQEAFGDI
jgi:TolB-like protein